MYRIKKVNLFNETYYNVYGNGRFYQIKEKDIKLNLGIEKVTEEDVIKYIEKYYY